MVPFSLSLFLVLILLSACGVKGPPLAPPSTTVVPQENVEQEILEPAPLPVKKDKTKAKSR